MINVALVDDHVIVRSGFAQLLSLESDINVVGEFNSVSDAKQGLPGSGAMCALPIYRCLMKVASLYLSRYPPASPALC